VRFGNRRPFYGGEDVKAYAGICTTSLSASGFSVIWGFSGWVMGVVAYACANLLDFLESNSQN